jgi:hypothetical protein
MFDKIFLIGAGGGGSWTIQSLASTIRAFPRTAYSPITIFDGDTFETKNVQRQCLQEDVGKNKAVRAAEMCAAKGIQEVYAVEDYVNHEMAIELFEDSQSPLIIAEVDNNATRKALIDAIQKVCIDDRQKDFLFITPGNSDGTEEPRGQVCWFGQINGTKYGQNPLEYDMDLREPEDFIPRVGGCMEESESQPQVIAANFMGSAHVLNIVQSVLTGRLKPELSQIRYNCNNLTSAVS